MDWQKELTLNIRTAQELCEYTCNTLTPALPPPHFPVNVTRSFADRIEKSNLNDPLLKQVLQSPNETTLTPGYQKDPLMEQQANPQPGLLHKYTGRVLLVPNGLCAIHCRYCFRQHFPYQENQLNWTEFQKTLEYIKNDPSIQEVIFSGGDPLMSSDRNLSRQLKAVESIPHVQRIRFHTRLPIVLPSRITSELIQSFADCSKQIIVVIHCNHANEINSDVETALQKLIEVSTVLNQSVLLKDINDRVYDLTQLSEVLFKNQVIPYYLHLLDKVQGAAHFDLPKEKAIALYRDFKGQTSGYLVPKLVCEESGQNSKTIVT